MNYIIKSPETKQEWSKYFSFRWELLRKPWNMPLDSLKDQFEDQGFHLIAMTNELKIIGTGRIHLINKYEAQIRYMAVSEDYRRTGLGSKILAELEKEAENHNVHKIILNARNNALDFYRSLKYIETGPYESDTGIPHTRMEKEISLLD
ncbi:MAG: GNAT family N-acetyltransferase [SAR86 cluster bacterium]|jgi:predicted GNAT family N-acyltransferase|nr:GNAT family N-acetyltransferase [SAR86 cluster bacterium]